MDWNSFAMFIHEKTCKITLNICKSEPENQAYQTGDLNEVAHLFLFRVR